MPRKSCQSAKGFHGFISSRRFQDRKMRLSVSAVLLAIRSAINSSAEARSSFVPAHVSRRVPGLSAAWGFGALGLRLKFAQKKHIPCILSKGMCFFVTAQPRTILIIFSFTSSFSASHNSLTLLCVSCLSNLNNSISCSVKGPGSQDSSCFRFCEVSDVSGIYIKLP